MSFLWKRMKERKLVQWPLAYLAAAWLLVQVCDVLGAQFGWSAGVLRGITLVFGTGFFLVLIAAWYHGEKGRQKVGAMELSLIALVLAIGGVLLWRFAPSAPGMETSQAAANAGESPSGADAAIPAKSVAVLPFENLSRDEDNAYFAVGMQDMILTKLSGVGELKVISRTSTEKYKSHPDNLKQIAHELGVAHIVEGSVQKAGNDVLINVQLIDARTDAHLWADSYQRTLDNVFGVQGEVAGRIAAALEAKLSPAEATALGRLPTQNPQAYDAFLRGEYHVDAAWNSDGAASGEHLGEAGRAYAEALRLDPGFALAQARWAHAELTEYWFHSAYLGDQDSDLLDQARARIDAALRRAPDLSEAHTALGYWHYWGHNDYPAAKAAFERALASDPAMFRPQLGLSIIATREGRPREAIARLTPVAARDPRNILVLRSLAINHACLGDHARTLELYRRIVAIDPEDLVDQFNLARTLAIGFGDVAAALAVLDALPASRRTSYYYMTSRLISLRLNRDYAGMAALAESAPDDVFLRYTPRPWHLAFAAHGQGQEARARHYFEQARSHFEAKIERDPKLPGNHASLGTVLAHLGQADAAIAAGRRAIALQPAERDALDGTALVENLAEIHATLGQSEEAVAILRELIEREAVMDSFTPWTLKLDPVWDPIRATPGFQALFALYDAHYPLETDQGAAP